MVEVEELVDEECSSIISISKNVRSKILFKY